MTRSNEGAVIDYDCPVCGALLPTESQGSGRIVRCPGCGITSELPEVPAAERPLAGPGPTARDAGKPSPASLSPPAAPGKAAFRPPPPKSESAGRVPVRPPAGPAGLTPPSPLAEPLRAAVLPPVRVAAAVPPSGVLPPVRVAPASVNTAAPAPPPPAVAPTPSHFSFAADPPHQTPAHQTPLHHTPAYPATVQPAVLPASPPPSIPVTPAAPQPYIGPPTEQSRQAAAIAIPAALIDPVHGGGDGEDAELPPAERNFGIGALASFAFHLAFLILLALLAGQTTEEPQEPIVVTAEATPPEEEQPELEEIEALAVEIVEPMLEMPELPAAEVDFDPETDAASVLSSAGFLNPMGLADAFSGRLAREGAKSGDIQISLLWNNYNDIDLHVTCPSGELIYYRDKRSLCRGELDVDMNAGGRRSREPVENVYWPEGKAPNGTYKVWVHHFALKGDPDPTPCHVMVIVDGTVKLFPCKMVHGKPKTLIYQFTREKRARSVD